MRITKKAAACLAAATLLALTGCSGDGAKLKARGGDVSNDQSAKFLDRLEDSWRDVRAVDEFASVPDDATCYLGARETDDGLRAVGQAFCGPVAVIGGAEGAVWDSFDVTLRRKGDDVTVDAPELFTGIGLDYLNDVLPGERPSKVTFFRPDGKTPAKDAEALEPPPAPPGEPGFVSYYDEETYGPVENMTELGDPTDQTVSILHSPTYDLKLSGLGTVETVGTGRDARSAATGEKLVAARFSITQDPRFAKVYDECSYFCDSSVYDGLLAETQFFIDANGERTPIADEFLLLDGTEQTLVLSVPEGAKLGLRVDGRDQFLSLDTGERTSTGVADDYYATGTEQNLSSSVPYRNWDFEDIALGYGANLKRAYLDPYSYSAGWAKEGKAYLYVDIEQTINATSYYHDAYLLKSSYVLLVDGKRIPLDADVDPDEEDTSLRFVVPSGTQEATLLADVAFKFVPDSTYANPRRTVVHKYGTAKVKIKLT